VCGDPKGVTNGGIQEWRKRAFESGWRGASRSKHRVSEVGADGRTQSAARNNREIAAEGGLEENRVCWEGMGKECNFEVLHVSEEVTMQRVSSTRKEHLPRAKLRPTPRISRQHVHKQTGDNDALMPMSSSM